MLDRAVPHSLRIVRWVTSAVLLVMFGLALTSMTADAPTFDEQGFLVRGLAYLRGEENGGNRHMRVGHPLGLNALNAALLLSDPSVRLPSDHPSWVETSFHRPAELFLWEIGNDVEHIMFLARLPTIWLGLLLAAVGARWSAETAAGWAGRGGGRVRRANIAGLITLILLAFDPNILAHTRLVTTDLGLAAAATLSGYTLWRFLRHPSWPSAAVAGACLGLLLNTKFTALLFLPLFSLVALFGIARLWRESSPDDTGRLRRKIVIGLFIIPVIGFLVLWAGHGFQMGSLRAPLPLLGQLGGAGVPLSNYLDQLLDIGNRLEVTTPSFLLGRHSDTGWWYYFPVAFLLKTPLPSLLLLLWSFAHLIKLMIARSGLVKTVWFDLAALLVPAVGFFAIALTTDINLGYRHILPVLPFLYVFAGTMAGRPVANWQVATLVSPARLAAVLLAWLAAVSLWIYPHYLAFFNVLAGGPDNGWRALVDSNLDWGQDLGRLADWLEEHEIERIWLSYFGEARPDYYGIAYDGLDSFPPRLMNPDARPYYPPDPAPGWYAISATTLQGVHFTDHDQFIYFREREPDAKIGYSIFLYEQPARGEPAALLLGGTQVDRIAPEDFALLGTNDVSLRWFDPGQALLLPGGAAATWLAFDGALELNPLFQPFFDADWANPAAARDEYRLYSVAPIPSAGSEASVELRLNDGAISFLDFRDIDREDATLTVVTSWRQDAPPKPVKIFVHLLNDAGSIVAQWDGLDAAWEGWREGDILIQIHKLSLDGVPAGVYRLVTGLYDSESFQRWTTQSGADVIESGEVTVP